MSDRRTQLASVNAAEAGDLFYDYFRLEPAAGDRISLERLISSFGRIPYENLSKIIKTGRGGDGAARFRFPLEVMEDHIDHRLGGTCFSLTFFLERLLTHAGYDCHRVMADMRAGRNIHCAVVIRLENGSFLIDPGYGLNRPIALSREGPVRFLSRHGGVELRFDPAGERYHLFTYMVNERKWRYSFEDRPVSDGDFERFWIESFSKPSLSQICLYRVSPQGHLYLHKHQLRVSSFRGQRKENVRKSLHQAVKSYFGIAPRWVDEAAGVLAERRSARPRAPGRWPGGPAPRRNQRERDG